MALAQLRLDDCDDDTCRFRIDLGRNRFYAFAIGDGETDSRHGIRVLRNRVHMSPVLGPLDDDTLGRGELTVPARLFRRDARSIQLISFRNGRRDGPAVSSIIEVQPGPGGNGDADSGDADLPPLGFSLTGGEVVAMTVARNRPMVARPARAMTRVQPRLPAGQLSEAQFFGALASLLPQILPIAGNILGSLFGGGGGAAAAPGTAAAAAPAAGAPAGIIPPAIFQGLQQLLTALGPAGAAGPRTTAAPTPAPPAPQVGQASLATRPVRAMSRAGSGRNGQTQYSEAQFLPALLAALPALAPLIQGIAQLGLQAEKQQLDHLRALNPGVDDPLLMGLLAQMSVEVTQPAKALRYRPVSSVRLAFANAHTVTLAGRQVVAYLRGRDLELPLSVETRRPIPPGILQLVVKHATSLEIVAEQRVKTPQLAEGRIPVMPHLTREELAGLTPGEPYIACAHLVWKTRSGERVGATMVQPFTAVGDYTFDSVAESGELIPLSDVDAYRDFWHKVWQDSFTRDLARSEFEVKYYYLLHPDQTDNAQLETLSSELEKGLRRQLSRLKSGLLLSPNRLNELLPRISTHPMLPEDRLAALMTPDFVERLRLAARSRVKFGGRPGTSAALWVFPEVKVQQVTLAHAASVGPGGVVIAMEPETVYFPVPAMAHFVGVTSE